MSECPAALFSISHIPLQERSASPNISGRPLVHGRQSAVGRCIMFLPVAALDPHLSTHLCTRPSQLTALLARDAPCPNPGCSSAPAQNCSNGDVAPILSCISFQATPTNPNPTPNRGGLWCRGNQCRGANGCFRNALWLGKFANTCICGARGSSLPPVELRRSP